MQRALVSAALLLGLAAAVVAFWTDCGLRKSVHFKTRADARRVANMESWFPRGMPEDVSEITLDYDLDTNTEDGTVLVSSAGQVAWRAALSRSRCPLDVAGDCFRDSLGDNSCAVVIFRAPSSIVRFRDCALLER